MRLAVTVIATATIEEVWEFSLSEEEGKAMIEDPGLFHDLINRSTDTSLSVTDRVIGDEENRQVIDVTEVVEA